MPDTSSLPYRPCAGVVLARADGLVFAGERINMPGAWQMPQGGIDKGETPREAALRELEEETGVRPDLTKLERATAGWVRYDFPAKLVAKVAKGRFRGQEQMWYLLRFNGTDADINIATEHAEFSRWQWMAPDDLIAAIVPFKRRVYQDVFAQFQESL
ncbi:MAG: RNA pyrophosphohydrolase [Pseudomonadota bacterium]